MLQLWTELTEAITRAAKEKDRQSFEAGTAICFFLHLTRVTVPYLSVIFVQPFKLRSSMFLQFCANVLEGKNRTFVGPVWAGTSAIPSFPTSHLRALSPTPRQPRRLSFLRNPPQRFEIFSTTRPCSKLQIHSAGHVKSQVQKKRKAARCFNHLNVPLKVEKVNSLPVAAVQGQNIPGLRVGWENSHLCDPDLSQIYNTHTHTKSTANTQSHTHEYTRCEHRLTRETWAQRQRVTTSRKEKILEDRQGWFRDPDHCC